MRKNLDTNKSDILNHEGHREHEEVTKKLRVLRGENKQQKMSSIKS